MTVSEDHRMWGEAVGVVCWLWVFHRARNDLPVLLGFRHAWEHAAEDPSHVHDVITSDAKAAMAGSWDKFTSKAMQQKETDDDDDDDEEDEDE